VYNCGTQCKRFLIVFLLLLLHCCYWTAALLSLQVLRVVEGPTSRAMQQGVQLGPANVPKAYRVRSGRQLE
jgi:hypothetical protein